MKKEKFLQKISNIASIISLSLLILPTLALWYFLGFTDLIRFLSVLIGILILVDLSIFIQGKRMLEKVNESLPLMKHRMAKYLAVSIFWIGLGAAIFLDAWNKGLSNHLIELVISVLFTLLGDFIYTEYKRRDLFIEKTLTKKNKKNSRKP